ncbi:hypothetical protein DACRYDRAFT_110186 [Dacryopinax primogenitus]|uniref:DUF4336 domain-containing protein n=1 Tax=Dacryopinax primogenitus (strain DJM 731) TaxID=1858805 RepID=M5FR07_DACPD|nr:uncharacterized protein DACRYDRAFT_110186 [Dacryopinax primogenitus]EJT99465.1 hypothetical protein DACRYDRAFT_110186 [Dacryopinax primogenitus]
MSDEIVIREVVPGLTIFSKPFARLGIVPFGGRTTAIKLNSGEVWVFVSTPLSDDTKSTLDSMGIVKYLVTPDALHTLYISEYHKAYPNAKCIGVEPLIHKKKDINWAGAYGFAEGTTYGYEDELRACYFSGFQNKDVAFLHIPSKTLIVADLLFNLPGKEQYSKSKQSGHSIFTSGLNPYSGFYKRFLNSVTSDKAAMGRDAKTVASWDFERIIPCHGDVIEGKGKEAWTRAYANLLK